MIVKIKSKFRNLKFNNNFILPSIVLTLAMTLIYNPLNNIAVNSFDRSLGNGLLNGVDITKRINNIGFFNFILIPIIFLIIYSLISSLFDKINEENKKYVTCINNVSAISLGSIIFSYINKFSQKDYFGVGIKFITCFILICLVILLISHKKKTIEFDLFKWSLFAAIPITLFIIVICNKLEVNISMKIFMISYGLILSSILRILTIKFNSLNFIALKKSYTLIISIPIIVSVCLELVNILNQHSIFINSKAEMTIIIYILIGVLSCIYYLRIIRNSNDDVKEYCFEKYYYPLIIVTIVLIATQMPLQNIINTDFFEQSNHGTAISEFFNYGKLPIIETFDAHMLQNELGRILYGILNNDYYGAMFNEYSLLPVFYLLYYFLFEKFFNKDISLLLLIFFPIASDNAFQLFPLSPLVILSLLFAYKHKTYKACILFWCSIILSCLLKLDMGFALAFSSIIVWGIVWLFERENILIKRLFLSFMSVVLGGILVYIGICLMKNISPILRIMEFLKLCQSNINWGYSSIGDSQTIAFTICYFVIPIINMVLVLYLIYKNILKSHDYLNDKIIIVLVFGIISVLNFSRGIVRHSLVENTTIHVVSTTSLFISMIIFMYAKRQKVLSFIVSEVVFMILLGMLTSPNNIFPKPIIDGALSKFLAFESYKTVADRKVDRVIISDDMKQVYIPLKEVLDATLNKDETYIDFTNQTFLYALVGREKPVYINQSPGLLSGEYTQQRFLEQVKVMKHRIPFVLMPIENMNLSRTLDGIENSYRYYLISEYISNNYRPLFKIKNFAIWCSKDQYDEKYKLIYDLIKANENNYLTGELTKDNIDKFVGINEELSLKNDELIIKSTGTDPILEGLEKIINCKEISKQFPLINISIEYESNKEGLFELFYTTDKEEQFTQDKSISAEKSMSGIFEATINCMENTKIRLDIPEGSTVKIKSIRFKGIEKQNNYDFKNQIQFVDYKYLQLEHHISNLGDIPYIWANHDKIRIEDKEEQLTIDNAYSKIDFSKLNKQQGNYLYINGSSSGDGTMTVHLGNESENGFVEVSQFKFSLKAGEDQKYLIRVSSDFMWYSNQINSIKITSDNNTTVNKVSILKGDTLK
ncbi:hypothetical protein [Clostridium butyricum]|uniref:Uncharacterized protein n=1 Tax=Clostridium butyricum TaxID=1492 RepID=A0AAP9RBT5_CLOBU|nr:hypothetical protein [Clostridium butyricum]MBZ5745726.1 hypothetical protein [Clostridium butyricum]MDB2151765.1 hypothetical protein [Clostridium butyricum]MDI9210747.1 hypothetical protein [Clostridium butyricum]QMW89738.1 hypothetical protein FF104_01915 [Clostridium butyricum]BBK78199.1 hypothetical protein Cbu04g_32070 [Clostridium butyricum]